MNEASAGAARTGAAMLDEAERDPVLSAKAFRAAETPLRTALLLAQYELKRKAKRAVLIVVAGIDGAGKGSTVNLLNEWLDARHVRTLAYGPPESGEAERPAMWRYWHRLPAKGEIGVVFGSWYAPFFAEASADEPDAARLEATAAAIRRFEAMLAAEGVQLVKLWFHLSREAQETRSRRLLADPDTAWRVSDADLAVARRFARLRQAAETVLDLTHDASAPWHVIPGADENLRIVRTAETVRAALEASPSRRTARKAQPEDAPVPDAFAGADYKASLDKEAYEERLAHWQGRLGRAVRDPAFRERALILVFEGDDAAGKGGTIRRIAHALDARQYELVPIAAPSEEERARPYLWRFWRHVPPVGRITVFDRSWYGRVLVERIEGFAREEEWRRAYGEIMDFESQLVAYGAVVLKFWLAITPREQLRRFRERERTPFKTFKITDEDWRNREKAAQYREAASEMFARTHAPEAPWHLVATDDKRLARVTVVETVARAVEQALAQGRVSGR